MRMHFRFFSTPFNKNDDDDDGLLISLMMSVKSSVMRSRLEVDFLDIILPSLFKTN
jgi:hypothetical protein